MDMPVVAGREREALFSLMVLMRMRSLERPDVVLEAWDTSSAERPRLLHVRYCGESTLLRPTEMPRYRKLCLIPLARIGRGFHGGYQRASSPEPLELDDPRNWQRLQRSLSLEAWRRGTGNYDLSLVAAVDDLALKLQAESTVSESEEPVALYG